MARKLTTKQHADIRAREQAVRDVIRPRTASTTLLVKAFPDYDVATLPVIPAGFIDSSWKNDACPSFAMGDLQLFVDYADPAVRECGADSPRFVLVEDQADGTTKTLAMTDVWSDMLAAIEAAK